MHSLLHTCVRWTADVKTSIDVSSLPRLGHFIPSDVIERWITNLWDIDCPTEHASLKYIEFLSFSTQFSGILEQDSASHL